MENASDAQDPQDPQDEQAGWGSTPPGSTRPKWLSAVAISAIAMGSVFGCCGITGIGGMIAGRAMNPALMQAQSGDDPRIVRVQQEYLKRSAEFQERVFPVTMTTSLVGLFHAFGLIAAGILAYRARPLGRSMLSVLCLAGIAVELVSGYVSIDTAQEQTAIMAPMMDDMMKAAGEGKGRKLSAEDRRAQETARRFMATAFKAGSLLGWLSIIGFFVVKTGYYVLCALYLRSKAVTEYFVV